ncbi:MAG: adenine-specific methyltransferase EcoRI family protein, partial [Spirochaetales bacterium]|nr:adenine-specific methyltransferase EcoRI family protein [Spirochaetales bacterium]
MANSNLTQAKNAKNDEFYTQWADIEREVQAYPEFDRDVFRDKTILCPCDDPEWSNFTKFFALHFREYGLKKLISTSYAVESKNYRDGYQLTLFEQNDPKFDADKTRTHGKIFVLESGDINRDGTINIEDLKWDYLEGDGDFRSNEVKRLRAESDIIITNPPFSLFREFLAWIVEADSAEVAEQDRQKAARLGYIGDYTRLGNSSWFTNLDHGRRHQPLPLMTMADNLKFSKHKEIKRKTAYDRYDNYDAIEVPFTDAIPADYKGVMGVPISFLDKYCPEQFEIVGMCENIDLYALKTKVYSTAECQQAYLDKFG